MVQLGDDLVELLFGVLGIGGELGGDVLYLLLHQHIEKSLNC
jgi:hypothetical protein